MSEKREYAPVGLFWVYALISNPLVGHLNLVGIYAIQKLAGAHVQPLGPMISTSFMFKYWLNFIVMRTYSKGAFELPGIGTNLSPCAILTGDSYGS